MIAPELLAAGDVGAHLGRQRWFAGPAPAPGSVRLERVEALGEGPPELWRLKVSVPGGEGPLERRRYQLVLALRPEEEAPDVPAEAEFGRFEAGGGAGVLRAYDALADTEACLVLLGVVAPGERAGRARPLGVEQTNTSVVYDERLVLKLYRRLVRGPNPDAEVPAALAAAGFSGALAPVAAWRRNGTDLALVQPYLAGGEEGWALALSSVGAGPGSFAAEARRLGEVTAGLHLALASAYGSAEGDPRAWADAMIASLQRLSDEDGAVARGAERVFARLRSVAHAGRAIRAHGDYHLGQVLRAGGKWFVLDFEGEPDRPLAERLAPTSPMKDVTGMLRSFGYAPAVAGADPAAAGAWEARCREEFLAGYSAVPGIEALLPADPAARRLVADAFELDKAVYELGYERAHRPGWASIPLAAVARLTARAGAG